MSRIRELRIARGWDQRELAKQSGVSQAAISDVENGKRDPNFSTMQKLAKALEVTVDELTGTATAAQ